MTDSTGYTTKKRSLVVALTVALFLAAMETTIITLATPTITRELAGFELMSLMFSSYLLTSAITTPIFGRLADTFGRKRMLITGTAIFLAGSVLCGLSTSMLVLIVFRGVQGIGAGAIFTLCYTIVGDAFELKIRGAILGIMSSVWGIAGLAGPLLGGFLIDSLSWHWVFYIAVPFGVVSIILLQLSLKEPHVVRPPKRGRTDRSGLFTRITVLVNIVALFTCPSLVGIDIYATLYLQSVLGLSPTMSGLAILPMSISWFLASYYIGKILVRFNAKLVVIGAGLLQLVCGIFLIALNETSSLLFAIFAIFLSGFGLGGLLGSTTIIIQESVGYSKRGTAMGINSFVKSIGQAVGVTALGVALNMQLAAFFTQRGLSEMDFSSLLQGGNVVSDSGAVTEISSELIASALDTGIDFLFWMMLVCTVVLTLVALFMPRVQLGHGTLDEQ
ncbi:MAG: MFS transporter [Coriobacteriales bacterium]|jgi:MFS family permease|nr:MFS transporter [Coriobacteriales bacterium]